MEDSQRRLWIGTLDGGLNLLDRKTFEFQRLERRGETNLYSPYISELEEDADGNIWIGTSFGIYVLEKTTGKLTHYYAEKNNHSTLTNNSILSIYQDAKRRMWVGTLGGLSLFDKSSGTFTTFTRKEGLPHNAVITMRGSPDG